MATRTFIEAIREGLAEEMRRDPSVIVLGEDVGKKGGVFLATDGLWAEFGDDRVIDTPLTESMIEGRFKSSENGADYFVTRRVPPELVALFTDAGVTVRGASDSNWLTTILSWIVPMLVLGGFWFFVFRGMAERGGIGGLTAYRTLLGPYSYDWMPREVVRPFYFTDNERLPQYATEAALRRRTNDAWLGAGGTMLDPSTTYVDATVQLAPDVTLFPGVVLQGATSIGAGTEIGPGCRLVDCAVGARSTLASTVAQDAEIGDDCAVGPFAALGPGTCLPAGTRTGPHYAAP